MTDELNTEVQEVQESQEGPRYTRKIEIPIYEPKNKMPNIQDIYDTSKRDVLQEEILKADLYDDLKDFLMSAAERHTKFNFAKIADFYAHAPIEIKKLFEKSALVIIDYDVSIKYGFHKYQQAVDEDILQFELEGSNW